MGPFTPINQTLTWCQVPALVTPAILLDALFHATIYKDHSDYSMFRRIDADRLEALAARIRKAQEDTEEPSHG